jgi:4-hydroxy-2-oxoheptanedioate aldolase
MKDIRRMISSGEPVIGVFSLISDPTAVEIIGYSGFDFVAIDTEHPAMSPYGTELESCIRAAYAADIVPFVRVTENSKGMILKALNLGAKGVIVPHVNTKEDAERLVAAARYSPVGRRSAAPIVRAARYGWTAWSEFWRRSNEDVFTIPILEERQSMENLNEIVSVPGLDVIYFGPFDLSMTMGYEGATDHPAVWDYLDKTVSVCQKKGLPVMNLAWNVEAAKKSLEKGCAMVSLGVDLVLLNDALRNLSGDVDNRTRSMKLKGQVPPHH